jgi:hypothetical protein
MSQAESTLVELMERLKRRAPQFLDLATAETAEQFEKAFVPLLEKAVRHLEENKRNYESLGEVGLTAAFAGSLQADCLLVKQELNSNGHVDITIEAKYSSPQIRKLGEAKIYDGPGYHFQGLSQLVGRYQTGRDTGLMLSYVRKRGIKRIVEDLRAKLDQDKPERQHDKCIDHMLPWTFVSLHEHSSGEQLAVCHVSVNLYI